MGDLTIKMVDLLKNLPATHEFNDALKIKLITQATTLTNNEFSADPDTVGIARHCLPEHTYTSGSLSAGFTSASGKIGIPGQSTNVKKVAFGCNAAATPALSVLGDLAIGAHNTGGIQVADGHTRLTLASQLLASQLLGYKVNLVLDIGTGGGQYWGLKKATSGNSLVSATLTSNQGQQLLLKVDHSAAATSTAANVMRDITDGIYYKASSQSAPTAAHRQQEYMARAARLSGIERDADGLNLPLTLKLLSTFVGRGGVGEDESPDVSGTATFQHAPKSKVGRE